MAIERTFSIIKPDATERNLTGAVNALIEKAGLADRGPEAHSHDPRAGRDLLCRPQGASVLRRTGRLHDLGPVVVQVLEGEGAVLKYRDVMGATDPSKAADGTIRKVHAKSIGENSVHGSDAPETAAIEIAQFFSGNEIVG